MCFRYEGADTWYLHRINNWNCTNSLRRWYIDGTFKLCRQPFTQLLTLNAFVKNDDHMKQVPLVFVIISGQKRRDYRAVLDAVTSILPRPPRVTKVMLDFETAVWSALRQTLPDVQLFFFKGCSFHWTQALWRKVGSYLKMLNDYKFTVSEFSIG